MKRDVQNKLILIDSCSKLPFELSKLKSLWIPKSVKESFIECFDQFLVIQHNFREFNWSNLSKPYYIFEEGTTIKYLQNFYPYSVEIYHLYKHEKFTSIDIFYKYPVNNSQATMKLFFCNGLFCLINDKKQQKFDFIERYQCNTCFRWFTFKHAAQFCDKHFQTCRQCRCGKPYKTGDAHPILCSQVPKKRGYYKDENVCQTYNREKERDYENNNHFADFECIHENGFEVDCTGIYNSNTKEVKLEWGKDSLKNFFNYITTLEGTLWFFNGGKFDNFFIFKYCVQNNIPISNANSVITKNWIQVLALKTKVLRDGKIKDSILVIKDLARFLQGSLLSNCEAFRIPPELYKIDFDHEKVTTWEESLQHKEERLNYLKFDVLALREVYMAYAKIIWDDFNLSISRFISSSQLSYAVSTLFMPKGKMKKIELKHELPFREAYYGGRIITTYQLHLSKIYEEIIKLRPEEITDQHYESITDDLKQYDANSLYPSQLYARKFPCGDYKHILVHSLREQQFIDLIIEESKDETKEYWISKLLCVTMKPPTDIYIPFLMTRDLKGLNQQTLEPIEEKWYSGVEVLEAIRLGYKLIRLHEYFEFEFFEPLFKEFVSIVYKRRLEARDLVDENGKKIGRPIDCTMKGIANQNTGKHAQRNFNTATRVIIGDEIYKSNIDSNCKFIGSADGNKIYAVLKEETQLNNYTPFSLPITLWCLSYSREFMSKFTSSFDGYRNKRHTPRYGDTDSVFIPYECVKFIDPKFFGDELGQFKDEMPNVKIIGLIVLAPKTYMKLILIKKDGEYKLMNQLKCKGITHTGSMYDYHADYSVNENEREYALKILHFLKNRKSKEEHYPDKVKLKKSFYITIWKNEKIEVTSKIEWRQALGCSISECSIISIVGTMERYLGNVICFEKIGIYLDYTQRSLTVENWWTKGKRIVKGLDEITQPIGFEEPEKDAMDYLIDFL